MTQFSGAMRTFVGFDFGTTNSAIAIATAGQPPQLARFRHDGAAGGTFRSVLFFHPDQVDSRRRPRPVAGAEAIAAYLQADGGGRLLQSMKSFLASHLFVSTNILGSVFTLEDLIAFLVAEIRHAAEAQLGSLDGTIVVGRPVHFSSAANAADDEFAVQRLRAALRQAGFADVVFEYEPVGAAYHYENTLDHDELILVADFGGGTSDFCLMHVGPGVRRRGRAAADIVGTDGVGVAGDLFDSRVVQHLLVPHLGRGSQYRTLFGQVLPVPSWIYARLERWHYLSLLKSRDTMEMLKEVQAHALEPRKIAALIHLIEYDQGFHLYQAVERMKMALSTATAAVFEFVDPPVYIRESVARSAFEAWIATELDELGTCVDRLLARTGVKAADVDRVFMTGGSSFVPAVRRLFEDRFGAARICGGDELTSVASGFALRALDLAG
jgi:hypothetical chaperone protein